MPIPTVRESLLEILDYTRGIPTLLDFRRYDVTLRVISWTGSRVGVGTSTVTDYPIVVNELMDRPKVKLLTTDEIIASNGLYVDGDYRVGPITPQYVALINGNTYGLTPDDISIPINPKPTEIYFILTGPLMPNGHAFDLIKFDVSRNLHYTVVIRKNAKYAV